MYLDAFYRQESISDLSQAFASAEVVELTPESIESSSIVGVATLAQSHSLFAISIDCAVEIETPILTQNHSLNPSDIEAVAIVESPVLSQAGAMVPDSIEAQSSVGVATLTQNHVIIAESIESIAEMSAVIVGSGVFYADIELQLTQTHINLKLR